ncbi:MAG TPA: SLBB domain-containing protein [Kofleriaceae bacterium]|jgi:protein involved in polysaccharide export with SLBB domain
MMPATCRTAVALLAITSIASAQPRPAAPSDAATGGDLKIPVTLRSGGEILGDEGFGNELVSAPPPLAIEHPIDPERYVCGSGDVFELAFWGTQNLQLKLATDLEGRVFIAKVGFVPVAGKTLSAVRAAVQAKVRAFYPGLTFDLTLVSPRSFLVHVADYVKHPGPYTSRALDRVSAVIGKAGGTTGSRRRIAIRHHDGTTGAADLLRYELTGDVAYNPLLLDGDVITVPFASPVVAINGDVRRPGRYELIETKDLTELLALAGGFTSSVSRALPLRLLRRNPQQQEVITDLPFAGEVAPNTALRDDDQIIVRGSGELQRTVLVLGAVVGADPLDRATTSRRIPFVEGDTVLSLLERAGGIKAPGDLRRSYISRPRPDQTPELIGLDLEALLVRRDFRADRPLRVEDTIVVPPMQYSVLIEGAVVRAGLYNYNPMFGITEYIAHAGGRTRTARDLDEVQLIDGDGHTHPFRTGMKPAPGDAIMVPERNFSRAEVAQLILAGAGIVLSGIAITLAATR